VHLARRMLRRNVQPREIVIVGLDVRAFGDLEIEIGQDRDDFVAHMADRMDRAARDFGAGNVTSTRSD